MNTSSELTPAPGPPRSLGPATIPNQPVRKATMAIIFVVVMICLIAAALWGFVGSRKKQSSGDPFQSLDDMMQFLAGEAVSMAGTQHGIALDYSEKSIQDVEKILGTIHEEYVASKPERGAMGLAMAFGAYIGEVIRRGNPGSKWERNHPVAGENSYPLSWLGGEIFPCGWCYKRIVNGPEDDVWHKYVLSKEQRKDE
jgi:hypothetical protein